jgi:anionic cell wall polymer biosynthesis LytR-Cps2A-Psr (LCP) family protein
MTVQSAARRRARRRARAVSLSVIAVVLLLVLSLGGYAVFEYFNLTTGIQRSDILGGQGSTNGDTNILIMGLDSRLDENGNPLPAAIYNALHAGDQSNGGLNANVLMLLHVPGDGSKATEISIPRDDYVHLAGCPDGECQGKIKQAYGLAFDQESRRLVSQKNLSGTQRQQDERDAGRKAEIATVKQFLGGVPVDHFVEVTLVAVLPDRSGRPTDHGLRQREHLGQVLRCQLPQGPPTGQRIPGPGVRAPTPRRSPSGTELHRPRS